MDPEKEGLDAARTVRGATRFGHSIKVLFESGETVVLSSRRACTDQQRLAITRLLNEGARAVAGIKVVTVVRDGILDEVYSDRPHLLDLVMVDVDDASTDEPVIVKAAEVDRIEGADEVEGWLQALAEAGGQRVVLNDNSVPQGPRAE